MGVGVYGICVRGFAFMVQEVGFCGKGVRFRVQGSVFKVWVQGLGWSGQGVGFSIQGKCICWGSGEDLLAFIVQRS